MPHAPRIQNSSSLNRSLPKALPSCVRNAPQTGTDHSNVRTRDWTACRSPYGGKWRRACVRVFADLRGRQCKHHLRGVRASRRLKTRRARRRHGTGFVRPQLPATYNSIHTAGQLAIDAHRSLDPRWRTSCSRKRSSGAASLLVSRDHSTIIRV